jgi:hypothetical protein
MGLPKNSKKVNTFWWRKRGEKGFVEAEDGQCFDNPDNIRHTDYCGNTAVTYNSEPLKLNN